MRNVLQFISSKKFFIIAGIILLGALSVLITKEEAPETNASNASSKYYTCITIEEGDTLWNIAGRYMTEEYSSTQAYIDEVLSINNMNTDVIIEGTNLLVPYYVIDDYE